MAYRTLLRTALTALCAIPYIAMAQTPPARTVSELPEAEVVQFVSEAIDAGFPSDRADQMTMLLINRSQVVVPLLLRRALADLRSPSPSTALVETATEMIAYSGSESALRAAEALLAEDPTRFDGIVKRTLFNSMDFRNPFDLVYRAHELRNPSMVRQAEAWTSDALTTTRMQRLLAEAMLARYKRVPEESDWKSDPIATGIESVRQARLKDAIISFAREKATR